MKNWKTTVSGFVLIIGSVFGAIKGQISYPEALTAITTGIGLIAAKDHNAK